MDRPTERLYHLLPGIFRLRDAENGEQLRAFMAVLEDVLLAVEGDIDALYENWFVQTCDDATVPYIADLVDVRGLTLQQRGYVRQRALVANAVAHRRRKGTLETLEHVARDATGWDARAVEFRELIATTQSLRHQRLGLGATVDLRAATAIEWLGTPYDSVAHTPDLRRPVDGAALTRAAGRPNLPDVGLFLWRLQSYPVARGTPFLVGPGRYTFHPLGRDMALYGQTRTIHGRARGGPEAVAHRLNRHALAEELDARRRAAAEGRMPGGPFFDAPAVFEVYLEGREGPIPPEEIVVGDLTDWRPPTSALAYVDPKEGAPRALPIAVAVDPVLGRLTCAPGLAVRSVSYSYGFSGDVGGGPYDRHEAAERARGAREVTWQCGVGNRVDSVRGEPVFATIGEAIQAWNALPPGETGLIALMDSATYLEPSIEPIVLSAGSTLMIVAGAWPVADWAGTPSRLLGQIVPEAVSPVLRGDLPVVGISHHDDARTGQLVVDGLLIDGALRVLPGALGRLRLYDSTLVPGRGGLRVGTGNEALTIQLERSIVGGVYLPSSVPDLSMVDCIVDGAGEPAIEASGATAEISATTVLGTSAFGALAARDAIFTGRVAVERRQQGAVETSYLPIDSVTPRRVRCQPDLALDRCASPEERARALARLVPSFGSTEYGSSSYAQLVPSRAPEIGVGASNESEMGAFNHLLQPLRHAHLRAAIEEYLGLGLEAGIYYVS